MEAEALSEKGNRTDLIKKSPAIFVVGDFFILSSISVKGTHHALAWGVRIGASTAIALIL